MKTAQLTTATPEWEAGPPNSVFPEERRPRKNCRHRVRKGREAKLKAEAEASAALEAPPDECVCFYDQPFEDSEACFNEELLEGDEARRGDEPLKKPEQWLDGRSLEEDQVCFDEDLFEGDEAWYDDDPLDKDEASAQTQGGDREQAKDNARPYWFEDYEFDENVETSYARRPRGL
ncbi:hypothetical protein DL770_002825 [Monosporascus sp. CRB-9-2]|nr:hypothetical protein DL770_002825 [Monosporascus sp. CRB-9-2]